MTTPIPLDQVVDEHRMELAVKRKRAIVESLRSAYSPTLRPMGISIITK